ncbi:MAG: hypothetical protein LBG92_03065 [Prevotellaceae bacterium]|jgi:hypothetical protein|nr:hypothetical protein [Prevotellaceae bacterium]
MARTVKEIKDDMTAMWVADVNIQAKYGLDLSKTFDEQFSRVSIESIWFYIVAFGAWALETLFDTHRNSMETLYRNQHAHTFEWYNNKAKAFMYGYSLIPFTSNYDTEGLTDEQIEQAKIVVQSSCVKMFNANGSSYLRLKVAKSTGAELQKLDATELAAFAAYMAEIQDAGVDLRCTSNAADNIAMTWTVYYDPQVLDGDGNLLDGTGSDVVETAIRDYVQQLAFNGLYKLTFHIDAIQKVRGVMDCYITRAQVKPELGTIWSAVTGEGVVSDAGYFKFYDADDLVINYIPFDLN